VHNRLGFRPRLLQHLTGLLLIPCVRQQVGGCCVILSALCMLNSAYAYSFRFLIACMPASKLGSGEFCPVIFIVMFDCQQSGSSSDLSRALITLLVLACHHGSLFCLLTPPLMLGVGLLAVVCAKCQSLSVSTLCVLRQMPDTVVCYALPERRCVTCA